MTIEHPQLSDERRERIAAIETDLREALVSFSLSNYSTAESATADALRKVTALSGDVSREPDATLREALERAEQAIHSEYCTQTCHPECVAVTAALAQSSRAEATYPKLNAAGRQAWDDGYTLGMREALASRSDDALAAQPSPAAHRPEPSEAQQCLSARWQELFWALPSGAMRHKLRALEIDMGRALADPSSSREEPPSRSDADS